MSEADTGPAPSAPAGVRTADDLLEVHTAGAKLTAPTGGRTADLDARRVLRWWSGFTEQVRERGDELTELDRIAGDGDFGHNLRAAVRGAESRLQAAEPTTASGVFEAVALGFLDTGGTSGPLLGMYLREFARSGTETFSVEDLATAAQAGVDTVRRLGGAEVGDKTMVDAMAPAAEALRGAADAGVPAVAGLAAAYRAAADGARQTEALRARRGRASYVGDVARGVVDPGALVIAWFFERGAVV